MNDTFISNQEGPEFVDCKGLEQRFGIRRSLAYELIKRNAIKSVSLRRRGAIKGKRLFCVNSVRMLLCNQGAAAQIAMTKGGL